MARVLQGRAMAERIELSSDLFVAHAKTIEAALRGAVREALLMHKRAGNPIAVWKDGQVTLVPPEEIPLDEPVDSSA